MVPSPDWRGKLGNTDGSPLRRPAKPQTPPFTFFLTIIYNYRQRTFSSLPMIIRQQRHYVRDVVDQIKWIERNYMSRKVYPTPKTVFKYNEKFQISRIDI